MKKKVAIVLAAVLLILYTNLAVFAESVDLEAEAIIYEKYSTDVKAMIDGYDIPAFKLNGRLAVKVSYLKNYGFEVVWNEASREVRISQSSDKVITPVIESTFEYVEPGKKTGEAVSTDIKLFANNKQVETCSLSGSSIIYFRDLGEFGELEWNHTEKSYKLYVRTDRPRTEMDAAGVSKTASAAVVYIETYDSYDYVLGSGSGFIVDPSGIVVTNSHVVDYAENIVMRLTDGRKFKSGEVIINDTYRDIAILKFDAENLPAVYLGDSDEIINGQRILTIGSPIGLENTISDGLVSNSRRVLDKQNYIQISAPVSSGSSGGALLNYFGEVIGVTSEVLEGFFFDVTQNLNLAIPINEVKPYIDAALNSYVKIEEEQYKSLVFENGDKYEGYVKNNQFNGKGTLTYVDGGKYEGSWEADYMHGYGVFTEADGTIYQGFWKKGMLQGRGTIAYADGSNYAGSFVDGKREGQGTLTYEDGTCYKGEWENDYMHGKGKKTYSNGDSYEGEFKYDLADGQGTYIWANGDKYVGDFASDKRMGYGALTKTSGSVIEGIWFENKCIGESIPVPSGLEAEAVSSSKINLLWDKSKYAEYYHIYISESEDGEYVPITADNGSKIKVLWNEDICHVLKGIYPDVTVYVKLSAAINGLESELSEAVSVTTFDSVGVPENVSAEAVSSESISVSWDAVQGADSYNVYWSEAEDGEYILYEESYSFENYSFEEFADMSAEAENVSSDTSLLISYLNENQTMYFKVTAVENGIESDYSQAVYATTKKKPAAPIGLWARYTKDKKVQIGWDKVKGADYYHIYLETPFGFMPLYDEDFNVEKVKWKSSYCYEFTGVPEETEYYIYVTSVDNGEESIYSNPLLLYIASDNPEEDDTDNQAEIQ
ncbi:MAG: trypsin-like peptidase domain-containing protein [Bacillota bacterium]